VLLSIETSFFKAPFSDLLFDRLKNITVLDQKVTRLLPSLPDSSPLYENHDRFSLLFPFPKPDQANHLQRDTFSIKNIKFSLFKRWSDLFFTT
jgi:hypothetical protein